MQGGEDAGYLLQLFGGGLAVDAHRVVDAGKDQLLPGDVVGIGGLLTVGDETHALAQHFEAIHRATLPGQFADDLAPVGDDFIPGQQAQQG